MFQQWGNETSGTPDENDQPCGQVGMVGKRPVPSVQTQFSKTQSKLPLGKRTGTDRRNHF